MAHTYTGFSSDNEKKIKSIVFEASKITAAADKDLADKRPKSKYFDKWFGKFQNNNFGQVRSVITKMHNALHNGTINFTYNDPGDCTGTTLAAAATPTETESYHEIETADDHDMTICDIFFNLRRYTPQNPGDDTQMQAFLHELSHLVGATDDEDHPNPTTVGQKAYGSAAALALALANPTSARNNADNYGFYCMDIGNAVLGYK